AADRRGAHLGRGPPRAVAALLRARGDRDRADRRQGDRGVPRGAAAARARRRLSRIGRLAAALGRPLPVTNRTNVPYLAGLSSSDGALLVEPGGATLSTHLRDVERARASRGRRARPGDATWSATSPRSSPAGGCLPGLGGARIENLVVAGDGGAEAPTRFATELLSSRGDGVRTGAGRVRRRHGRGRLHEPVQERDAHRAPRLGVADRRVPARQAGQGR